MDPVACLEAFDRAMMDGDRDAIVEHADALIGWLDKGGFMPCGPHGADWRGSLSRGQLISYLQAVSHVASMPATSRVLIEVSGGVADFRQVGDVDVHLVDYDNERDENGDDTDDIETEAEEWLNAEPVPLTPAQSDLTILRRTLKAVRNDSEDHLKGRGSIDTTELFKCIIDACELALAGKADRVS